MLSIGLVGQHQERYYTDLAAEDYYTDGGEPPGRWFGAGAEVLGLSGSVGKETLSELVHGFAPDCSKLTRNAGSATRRAAFDLTFSADKSVSVAFALADDPAVRRAIQDAHHAAVEAGLSYIEGSAARVRLGRDGIESVSAGLIAATFEHGTARLVEGQDVPDPHLHTHALVINAGVTEDGRTAALDSRELYRHKMAAGAVYRAELFRQLEERLGLTASRGERFCSLDAIPQSLVDLFSKRRRAIEVELERLGVSGARESAKVTLETRTTKPTVDRARFFEEWQRVGREQGFSLSQEDVAAARERTPQRDPEALVRDAVSAALRRSTEQQSHFAERELVRAVAEELEDKGVGAQATINGARAYLESAASVDVGESKGERRYTTREMLELEQKMLEQAGALSLRSPRVSRQTVERVLEAERFQTIGDEQRHALEHVTQGRAVALVRGVAGSGKTYMLEAARRAFEQDGFTVVGCALAAAAAKRLEEGSGIQSSSLHRLLHEFREGKRVLSAKTVVVVDEAAMVGTRQMADLVSRIEAAGAKLVLVGDDRQLQAIDAGAPFASMARRFGSAELSEIRRQKSSWAREAVSEFADGRGRAALKRFVERGLVKVTATRTEARYALVAEWREAVDESGLQETLVLTGTRADAARLNREIQLERRARGEVSDDRLELGDVALHVGDRVLFRKNSRLYGIRNGDFGEVVGIGAGGLTVRLDDGSRITVHPDAADQVQPQLGYACTTHAAQGATVDRCLVLMGGSMQDQEATYVQASRARVETRLFADELTAGEGLEELFNDVERSRRKDLASDLVDAAMGQRQEVGW